MGAPWYHGNPCCLWAWPCCCGIVLKPRQQPCQTPVNPGGSGPGRLFPPPGVGAIPCSLSFRTTFRGAGSSSRSGRAGACGRCRIIICISAFSFSASPFDDFAASCRRRSSFDCPFFTQSFLLSISLSIQAFRFFAILCLVFLLLSELLFFLPPRIGETPMPSKSCFISLSFILFSHALCVEWRRRKSSLCWSRRPYLLRLVGAEGRVLFEAAGCVASVACPQPPLHPFSPPSLPVFPTEHADLDVVDVVVPALALLSWTALHHFPLMVKPLWMPTWPSLDPKVLHQEVEPVTDIWGSFLTRTRWYFPTSLCGVLVLDSVSRLLRRLLLLLRLRPLAHNFVTHHLSHTTLSHAIFHTQLFSHTHTIFHTQLCHNFVTHTHATFHTQLCHTPSFTHIFVTHHLSHTTLSHTIFHAQLCHTHNFVTHTHHLSHTIYHTHLSHTTLSPTIFHTHTHCHAQLCHTICHTHTTLSHTIFHTHNFVTHHLSHTTLSHTIFHTHCHTQLCHTHNFVTHHLLHTTSSHMAGVALLALGWLWWRAWGGFSRRLRRRTLCGTRGTWWHPPSFCVAGVALGWLWWRAWGGFSRRWRRGTLRGRRGTWWYPSSRGRRGTWWHPPAFCMAGVALMALGCLWWRLGRF